jgi:peptidoglycan DL-endopeptidase CwlO
MFDRKELAERISEQDQRILQRVEQSRRKIQQRKKQLGELEVAQQAQTREAEARKERVDRLLNERQERLDSVDAEIRTIMEERRRRAAEAEAARSRALAREAAQQRSAPPAGPDPGASVISTSSVPAGPKGQAAVSVAMRYIGTPYLWGGSSPAGFDCSGLTMYSYSQVGISLPRTTYTQWNAGPHVARSQLQPGDLVFFNNLGHMGMYVGGGNFIHSPHTGDVVKISSLNDSWYASTYMGAVRVA